MKYKELIHFEPITTIVKLVNSSDKKVATNLVKTFVFSAKIKEDIVNQKNASELALDKHLFELNQLFPHTLYKADLEELRPLIDTIEKEAKDSYVERVNNYNKINIQTQQCINKFIEDRNTFFNKTQEYTRNEVVENEQDYYLPLTIIEIYDEETNDSHLEIIPTISVDFFSGQSITSTKAKFIIDENLYSFKEFLNQDKIRSKIINETKWEENKKRKEFLINELNDFYDSQYSDGIFTGVKQNLLDAVISSDIKFLRG